MKKSISLFMVVLCLLTILLTACVSSNDRNLANMDTFTAISFSDIMKNPKLTKGKNLFDQNCEMCHSLIKQVDGSRLQNMEKRIPDRKRLHEIIKNYPELLKENDSFVVSNYKEFGVMMPSFTNLSDTEIDMIIDYIRVVSAYQKLPPEMMQNDYK